MAQVGNGYRDLWNNPIDAYNNKNLKTASAGGKNQVINAIFNDKDKEEVSVQDFLSLMIAQLRNQDFMNPVDDTQYVTQLAQFATMKSMEEMAAYSKQSFAMGLAGKNVTVAKFNVSGNVEKVTGAVQKVSLAGDEFQIYVKGKSWTLDQVMEVGTVAGTNGTDIDVSESPVSAKYQDGRVNLEWNAATMDESAAEKIGYTVYYVKESDLGDKPEDQFKTVEDVERYGKQTGASERKNLTSEWVQGLETGERYYFNVVVTGPDGKKHVYKPASCVYEGEG